MSSTPSFKDFEPRHIHWQTDVINSVYQKYDYSLGVQEILFSGTVGSAKSILAAHLILRHCIEHNHARVLLGRRALPDLKATIFKKILEHMHGTFVEDVHYNVHMTEAWIRFANGSEIISRSWADKNYEKFRSLELSMIVIEELTENEKLNDLTFYNEMRARVGRLPHIKQNLIIACTNPGSPSSKIFEYWFVKQSKSRHIFYSYTKHNPFLPKWYIEQLEEDLDPKMARRLLHGEWVEIKDEVIYYCYDREIHHRNTVYEPDERYPIHICFDFNIAYGKPMSACAFQFVDDAFHFFDEWIIDGADTEEICYEIVQSKTLSKLTSFVINGDATGKSRSPTSKKSNYDIIRNYFSNNRNRNNYKIDYKIEVPQINPPVRERHNTVNGYMRNAKGKVRLYTYAGCPTLDKGFRLTRLKEGANYIEDDSLREQHVTTAAGYGIMYVHRKRTSKSGMTTRKVR